MTTDSILSAHFWIDLWVKQRARMLAGATEIAVIVLAYFIVRFVVLRLIFKLTGSLLSKVRGEVVHERESRIRTLKSILGSAIGFVLGFVAVIMILQAAGFNIVPLITTASVAGLAVGFGAQKLVRDVIAGIFILIEDQYAVGDYVTIGAVTGIVEELGMRITRIRDTAGRLCILSNGDIAQVCNHSRGSCRYVQDIAVAAGSDLAKVRSVVDEVGQAVSQDLPHAVLEPLKSDGLAQIGAASLTIRLRGGVDARYQEDVRLAVNGKLQEEFARNGITPA